MKEENIENLYKYCPYGKYTERIIRNSMIYFCPPSKFNDPFDTRINFILKGTNKDKWNTAIKLIQFLDKSYKPPNKTPKEEKYNEIIEELAEVLSNIFKNIMGILSLSANNNNILMWSHYAQNHKGFCLRFKKDKNFFPNPFPIIYSKKLPVVLP